MAVKRVRNNISYSPFGSPYAGYQQLPVISERNPSSSDIAELGTVWVNKTTGAAYILTFVAAGAATWTSIAATAGSFTTVTSAGTITATNGNLVLGTAGNKLSIATGANASLGTAVLVAGTVTVSTTAVTANSKIFLTCGVVGGTQGILSVGTIVAGTSFVINSSNAADTSSINWIIFN